jgi:hypothetical protein
MTTVSAGLERPHFHRSECQHLAFYTEAPSARGRRFLVDPQAELAHHRKRSVKRRRLLESNAKE